MSEASGEQKNKSHANEKSADFSTAKEITAAINIFAFHFWPMTKIKDTAAGNKPRQIFSAKQKDAERKREWPKIISFFSRGKIMAGALFLGQEKKQQK